VGVTSAQASWLVACETRNLRPVSEPRNEDKVLLIGAKRKHSWDRRLFVSMVILLRQHPHPALPLEGEGSPWPHGSGPPRKSFSQLKDTALAGPLQLRANVIGDDKKPGVLVGAGDRARQRRRRRRGAGEIGPEVDHRNAALVTRGGTDFCNEVLGAPQVCRKRSFFDRWASIGVQP
jgi:hypothetical protein